LFRGLVGSRLKDDEAMPLASSALNVESFSECLLSNSTTPDQENGEFGAHEPS
jgi:hypothetical protein